MNAIAFAIIAFIAWGIGITFEAIAARKIDSKSLAFWGALIGFTISSLYVPFALPQLKEISLFLVVFCLLLGLLVIAGSLCYYEALKKGNPSLVGIIGSSFPLVTVILSIILFKEQITSLQGIVIIVIILGLILSTLNIDELKRKKVVVNNGVWLSLMTMLFWGIFGTLIKIPIAKIGWFWPNWLWLSAFPLIYLYMKITKAKLAALRKKSVVLPVVLSIILVRIAEFSYNLGLTKGNASIVAPIAGANPILFVILAYFIFKEPLHKHQIVGIASVLGGIVILSALSA